MRKCSKCDKKHWAKNLCQTHYINKYMKQWRKKNREKENMQRRYKEQTTGKVKKPYKPVTKKMLKER